MGNCCVPIQRTKRFQARLKRIWRNRQWRNARLLVSGTIFAIFVFIGVMAPVISPHDPLKLFPGQILKGPSAEHWLGTDELGRSVASRMIHGARASLEVSVFAVTLATLGGAALGLSAAFYGGMTDMVIMRLMDVVLCLPIMIVVIACVAFLGSSITNLIFVIGVLSIPGTARIVYTTALSVKQAKYVEAARAIGASSLHIILKYILPNSVPPLLVHVTLSIGFVILTESGLSFLGLGPSPPEPTWGQMISVGRVYIHRQPFLLVCPMLAVSIIILALNILGDALRDLIDPRIRERVQEAETL